MKFSTFAIVALKIGGALLALWMLRWLADGEPDWTGMFWLWASACTVLFFAWLHAPQFIPPEDVAELQRWRVAWREHHRWLAEFPDIDITLANMKAYADGEPLSIIWPPGAIGPWDVSRLQEILRQRARSRPDIAAEIHAEPVHQKETTPP